MKGDGPLPNLYDYSFLSFTADALVNYVKKRKGEGKRRGKGKKGRKGTGKREKKRKGGFRPLARQRHDYFL